ncbi:MAG: hypothetical protein A2W31_05380, partial [Planctomycetes bacterium RBG_16_64_10]
MMSKRIAWLGTVIQAALVIAVLARAADGQAQPLYLEGPPPEAEQAFTEGQKALDEGRFDEAVGLLSKAIRLAEEEYPQAHLRLGQAYLELDDFQRAVPAFQAALQQKEELADDQQAEAYNGLGEAYLEFGAEAAAAAVQSLAQAAQIGYQNPKYLLNLGVAYVRVRDPERAIKVLDKAIGLDERLAKAYATRGQARGLLAQVRPEELDLALADFDRAIQLDSTDKTFHYDLGMVLLQSERLEPAIQAFTQAIVKDQEQAARRKQTAAPSQTPPVPAP